MAPTTRRGPNTPVNDTNPNNMTPESVQAMIDQALLRNSTNGDGSHSSHGDNRRNVQTARPCFYADFMKCQPLNFKGAEGVVGLTRWIEKMESVFNISGCAVENQVKFATCTLLGAALTWWNGQIRTLGPEAYAMTWEVLKRKMTDKYYSQGEIKKLEIELWNLKVKGNDVPAYTNEEPIEDEEEEEHLAFVDSSVIPVVDPVPSVGDIEAFETDESAPTPRSPQTKARIAEHAAAPIPPTSPAYDQAPLGHRAAMIRMRDDIPKEDMPPQRKFVLTDPSPGCDVAESSAAATRPPRGEYDFVDTVEAGQGLIRSPSHDAQTIARAADRAEDVGYVRALQASKHRMMTSIDEVNLRVSYQAQVHRRESKDFYTQLHDARTDRKDIRLKIDVVRGQRTAYEIELHEVHQAYLSFEAQNRALLARLETLKTHISRMEWQRQRAEDHVVRLLMRT
ncbi:putative reverse transcriptase domain-containing protein [Tanacetum coccineum]